MRFLFLVLICFSLNLLNAQNLVPNPSFENNTGLPTGISQWDKLEHWDNAGTLPSLSLSATPDYFHLQGSGSALLPFASTYGEVYPLDGEGIVRIITYSTELNGSYREYIETELLCQMIEGETYEVSLWYTYGKPNDDCSFCGVESDKLQVLFSEGRTSQNSNAPIIIEPQLSTISTEYDSLWHQVVFEYTADQNYNHITIGSFLPDSEINYIIHDEGIEKSATFFIDQVLVKPLEQTLMACADTTVCQNWEVKLESVFQEEESEWFDLNTLESLGSGNVLNYSGLDNAELISVFEGDTALYTVDVVSPFPNFSIGEDTLICDFGPSEFLSIAPNYQSENATYSWSSGSSYSSVATQEPVTLSLEMMDEYHCYYTDTIVITEETYLDILDLGSNQTFCEDETLPDLIVNVLPFAFDSIVWSSGETTQVIQPTQTGWYNVDVFKEHCIESDEVYINVKPLPQLPFMGDTILCLGEEYELIPDLSSGGIATWNGFDSQDSYIVNETEAVHLQIKNECGVVVGTHNVTFEDCLFEEECKVYIPNVFSPNDDGINDRLQIFPNCEIENVLFQVFDRWGSIAFETDDIAKEWTGNFGESDYALSTGYVYRLSYNVVGESEVKYQHGSIAIIR